MALRTEPAAAGRFADVEAILAPKKAGAQGCWCLTYRLPLADNDALRQPHRAEELLRLCRRRSHVPGVLAYDGDEVVGWAAIAPRNELKGLAESHFASDPDDPWALTCFRVRAGHGRQGVARALLTGAVEYAVAQHAPAVIGYPVAAGDQRIDRTQASVGLLSWFTDAGFRQIGDTGYPRERTPPRHRAQRPLTGAGDHVGATRHRGFDGLDQRNSHNPSTLTVTATALPMPMDSARCTATLIGSR